MGESEQKLSWLSSAILRIRRSVSCLLSPWSSSSFVSPSLGWPHLLEPPAPSAPCLVLPRLALPCAALSAAIAATDPVRPLISSSSIHPPDSRGHTPPLGITHNARGCADNKQAKQVLPVLDCISYPRLTSCLPIRYVHSTSAPFAQPVPENPHHIGPSAVRRTLGIKGPPETCFLSLPLRHRPPSCFTASLSLPPPPAPLPPSC